MSLWTWLVQAAVLTLTRWETRKVCFFFLLLSLLLYPSPSSLASFFLSVSLSIHLSILPTFFSEDGEVVYIRLRGRVSLEKSRHWLHEDINFTQSLNTPKRKAYSMSSLEEKLLHWHFSEQAQLCSRWSYLLGDFEIAKANVSNRRGL